MTAVKTAETLAGLVPVAVATEASLLPPAETWAERLGVAAVLVVVGYFLLRWFMAQTEKKDAVMLQMVQEHAKAQAEANALLVRELQSGHEAKRQMAAALDRLTSVIEARE